MIHPKPYQMITLFCCAAVGLVCGVLNQIHGAAPESRFYRVDKYIVRLLGLGLFVFSVLLFLQQFWAINGLILFFALSIVEAFLTFRPKEHPLAKSGSTPKIPVFFIAVVTVAFITIVQGIPFALLLWLRPAFTN